MADVHQSFYERELGAKGFYENAKSLVNSCTSKQCPSVRWHQFLASILPTGICPSRPCVRKGDTRVDVPVWFGHPNDKRKILIVGREPRHTHDRFNVLRLSEEKKVFASPFGVDCWTEDNSYCKAFVRVVNDCTSFVVFTDLVKEYFIIDTKNKQKNDEYARMNLSSLLLRWAPTFQSELFNIKPTELILLGTGVWNALGFLARKGGIKLSGIKRLSVVDHPRAKGGANTADMIAQLLYAPPP